MGGPPRRRMRTPPPSAGARSGSTEKTRAKRSRRKPSSKPSPEPTSSTLQLLSRGVCCRVVSTSMRRTSCTQRVQDSPSLIYLAGPWFCFRTFTPALSGWRVARGREPPTRRRRCRSGLLGEDIGRELGSCDPDSTETRYSGYSLLGNLNFCDNRILGLAPALDAIRPFPRTPLQCVARPNDFSTATGFSTCSEDAGFVHFCGGCIAGGLVLEEEFSA